MKQSKKQLMQTIPANQSVYEKRKPLKSQLGSS